MRVSVVHMDGSPAEIADLLERSPGLTEGVGNGYGLTAATDSIPREAREALERAPAQTRELLQRFLDEVLRWGSVDAIRGRSRRTETGFLGYIRLQRRPAYLGAFAYVMPVRRKIHFRLPREAADGRRHAHPLNRQASNTTQVELILDSEAALEEALQLAREAYERAAGRP